MNNLSFLSPFAAAWWLLALLPVLVHLFNRLRHRKLPWAAMMFLRMANRKSTRYAKLRQWLVLLFRVLVVVALLFALSRPKVGGWVAGMFGGKPDVILIILDGSASMGAQGSDGSRYEDAVDLMVKTVKTYGDDTRIVLLRHTDTRPQEVKDHVALRNLAGKQVTDTAADLPGLLEAAANWFRETIPGRGEIWIASDLQASNWDPSAKERWSRLVNNLDGLPQKVRVQLMAFNREMPNNVSIRIKEVNRHRVGDKAELELEFEFICETAISRDVDVEVFIDGKKSSFSITMEGASHIQQERFALEKFEQGGSGYAELVDNEDGNTQDNRAYFVYGAPDKARAAVVGDPDEFSTRFLKLAAAPNPTNTNQISQIIAPIKIPGAAWADYSMVLWQGELPSGETAEKFTSYLKAGGIMVCFPGNGKGGETFNGIKWGPVARAQKDGKEFENWQALVAAEEKNDHLGFVIDNWNDNEGPFKRTEEGLYLPVGELRINMRRPILHDEGTVLANLSNGDAMVLRKNIEKGQLIVFGTQPTDQWSSLTEGIVLVPMLQRLFIHGEAMSSGRFAQGRILAVGDDRSRKGERWVSMDTEEGSGKEFNEQAGIFRLHESNRVVAMNRPAREDAVVPLDTSKVKGLFGEVSVFMTEERLDGAVDDPEEIWKWFLAAMALALLIEGFLILPKSTDERVEIQSSTTGKVQTQRAS